MIKYFLLFTLVVIYLFITSLAICQEKPTVGVIDLELTGQIDATAKVPLSDELRKELFKTGKFYVLERNSMAEILKEQKFQRTDACLDAMCIVDMGKVLGVQKMVAGSLGKVGRVYVLNVRLINVETGEVEQVGDDSCQCELEELLASIATVAKKIAGLPVKERAQLPASREQGKAEKEQVGMVEEGAKLMLTVENDMERLEALSFIKIYVDNKKVAEWGTTPKPDSFRREGLLNELSELERFKAMEKNFSPYFLKKGESKEFNLELSAGEHIVLLGIGVWNNSVDPQRRNNWGDWTYRYFYIEEFKGKTNERRFRTESGRTLYLQGTVKWEPGLHWGTTPLQIVWE